jgi:electron transfer flavoprotein alpha subunit
VSGVLVVAEERRGEVREVSLELVEAGRRLVREAGGPLVVGLACADAAALAPQLDVEGVDEIVTIRTPREHFEAHVAEQALEALIADVDPAVVLLGHTIDALGYAPAVAARTGCGFATDALAVEWDGGPVARRGAYGDRLVARVEFPGRERALVLLRTGSLDPATGAGAARTRALEVAFDESAIATEHRGYREAETGDVDITKAEFLLSVGRGIGDKDNLPQFEQLAEALGATLTVSRPIVDAGWMPSTRQVGQSGMTVKPKLYLALGISGAVQHLAGMRKADTIIAVNSDPEAPIFNVAHYGAVADLFDIAEALAAQRE